MPNTTDYTQADELRNLAQKVIKSHGLDFGDLVIGYLFREVRNTNGELEVPDRGDDHPRVKCPGREDRAALENCPDVWVIISRNWWDQADADDWERVVFHALKHICVNEKDKFFLAKHEIEAWNDEFEFYADNTSALRTLKLQLVQQRLPGMVAGFGAQSARELAEDLDLDTLKSLRDMCPMGEEELEIEHRGQKVTLDKKIRKRLNERIRQCGDRGKQEVVS